MPVNVAVNVGKCVIKTSNEDGLLRRVDAEVYARVQAAAVHTLYGYLDYLARNLLPDLADEAWLVRHGNIKRCPRKGATTAQGYVRWEGVQNAISMSSDTEIQRDDGHTYTALASTSVVNGVLRVPVRAQKAGQAGNCEDKTALRLLRPITALSSTGYADEIQGGGDIEDLERWRQRIIARWYDLPQGGGRGWGLCALGERRLRYPPGLDASTQKRSRYRGRHGGHRRPGPSGTHTGHVNPGKRAHFTPHSCRRQWPDGLWGHPQTRARFSRVIDRPA